MNQDSCDAQPSPICLERIEEACLIVGVRRGDRQMEIGGV